MLITAICLFVIAALFGLVVLIAILTDKTTPKPAVFTHGILVIVGLSLVALYAASQQFPKILVLSIVLLSLAALGGLVMFILDMQKRPVPKIIAIIHPLIAILGLVVLVAYFIR